MDGPRQDSHESNEALSGELFRHEWELSAALADLVLADPELRQDVMLACRNSPLSEGNEPSISGLRWYVEGVIQHHVDGEKPRPEDVGIFAKVISRLAPEDLLLLARLRSGP
jgi:hypothetical protein